MTADQYAESVVARYAVPTGEDSLYGKMLPEVGPFVAVWAGDALLWMQPTGSYAKGTATTLGTDFDIFASLDHARTPDLKEMYWSLFRFCADHKLEPEAQNVSIRVC